MGERAQPEKKPLTPFHATLLVLGGIVGVGIFFNPAQVAQAVPTEGSFLLLWGLGGLLALTGAWTFAELGARLPRPGGWYVYLREAFPPWVAFLFAWVVVFVVSSGAIAIIVSLCALNLRLALEGVWDFPAGAEPWIAGGLVFGLTGLALGGLSVSATLQSGLMLLKLFAIAGLLVASAAWSPAAEAAAVPVLSPGAEPAGLSVGVLALAMLPVLFSYGGWHFLCYTASEVENPRRVLPRAIVVGVFLVVLLYLGLNLALVRVLGLEGLAASGAPAAELGRAVLGEWGGRFVAGAVALSALGVATVLVSQSPWLLYAMAREGSFFPAFGRLDARGAPRAALLLQGVVAGLYLGFLGWQRVDALVGAVVFAEWIFHALAAWALLRLRRRDATSGAPTRLAPPGVPQVYGTCALFLVGGSLWQGSDAGVATGFGILLTGLVAYPLWRRFFPQAAAPR